MGIRHLDTFIRRDLPNGIFEVNIEDEIKNYYENSNTPDPPAPTIVIDLMSLFNPICQLDLAGTLCGGRHNQAAFTVERFCSRLKDLGTTLVFYRDGPVQESKRSTWLQRQDEKYQNTIKILNAIERNRHSMKLTELVNRFHSITPAISDYPYAKTAKRYGIVRTAMNRECDQELAAFATSVNAIAVISNDTDFTIFEGGWRLWSSKDINFETLTTYEYNRAALVEKLGLNYKQMALFATLGGNDVLQYDEVKSFHAMLGSNDRKFYNLADFVRHLPGAENEQVEHCLRQVFKNPNSDQRKRFEQSLEFYDLSYSQENSESRDTADDEFLKLAAEKGFLYQVFKGRPVKLVLNFQDLRQPYYGAQFPTIAHQVMMKEVGIIQYHRNRSRRDWEVLTKLHHEARYGMQQCQIIFPENSPPNMLELHSSDPEVQTCLKETKVRMLCWIASDNLNYWRLHRIPEPYLLTVITLYSLIENQTINLFEADLLLFVTFMVYTKSYDFCSIPYPTVLIADAVHAAFLFTGMFKLIGIAAKTIGLSIDDASEGPHFDGVLFQQLYDNWRRGRVNLQSIEEWRIYAN